MNRNNRTYRWMKTVVLLLMLHLTITTVSAQTDSIGKSGSTEMLCFGYLDYQQALLSMPQYALAQKKMADLRKQYDAELQRVTNEFNRKYEEFLDGQHEFPKTILQKRQTELQDLITRNIAFKEEGRRQLVAAEEEAMAPLKQRLAETVAKIASERGLILVINTASDACPYLNPEWGEDLNQLVKDALQ